MIFSLNRNIELRRRMIANTFYYLICEFIRRKSISEDKKSRRICQDPILIRVLLGPIPNLPHPF